MLGKSPFRVWLESLVFCERMSHRFSVYRKRDGAWTFIRYARVCEKCGKLWRLPR